MMGFENTWIVGGNETKSELEIKNDMINNMQSRIDNFTDKFDMMANCELIDLTIDDFQNVAKQALETDKRLRMIRQEPNNKGDQ